MNLYEIQQHNKRKSMLMLAVFLFVVLGLGWLFATYLNNVWILYASALFAIVMNVGAYWFSDKIALASVGAVPIDKKDNPELYRLVENLTIASGLPMPKIYIIKDPSPNAFATGRDPQHSAVAVTEALLQILDKKELEGVLAHELSHIQNRDTLVMTVAVVLVGFISILADMFLRVSFWGGDRDSGKANALFVILFVIALIVAPIAGQLLQLAISRKREYLADASGALITRYPEGLASALEKIAHYGKPMRKANSATAHLFIANPFGEKGKSFASKIQEYFSTHPPIEKRIQALRGMQVQD